ncbi:MAG: alpha/beta hydrolase [Gammaproteobacteria bacterium]|nr:alpha/beta hydrolase [Gammaproteobacteria bacterium]
MKLLKYFVLTTIFLLVCSALILYQEDIPSDVVDARYTNADSQFLELGDLGRVHYRDEGRRQAPPIILLHGSNASLHTFEPWVTRLKDKYRIVTIDLPGHGLTGAIPSGDYSKEAMVKVVNVLANELGLKHFVIGGNSMGGGIALRYALDHPKEITGLVLINSSGFTRNKYQNDDSQGVLAFRLLKNPLFRAIGEVIDPYYFVSQGLEAAFHQHTVVTETMVMRYYDLALREGTRKAIMKRFSATRDTKYQAQDLARIEVPTLLMWGKEDAVIPFAFASGFETLIPGISTAYYDGVGHIPMEEVPEISAADLVAFMEKIDERDR